MSRSQMIADLKEIASVRPGRWLFWRVFSLVLLLFFAAGISAGTGGGLLEPSVRLRPLTVGVMFLTPAETLLEMAIAVIDGIAPGDLSAYYSTEKDPQAEARAQVEPDVSVPESVDGEQIDVEVRIDGETVSSGDAAEASVDAKRPDG